mmetsp:Transcript_9021/g.26944  ORF Transcript_9021/g.26944 Transcript_9021/m.26944 type:complete len:84 (-) Transcript_9021:287-538(-)
MHACGRGVCSLRRKERFSVNDAHACPGMKNEISTDDLLHQLLRGLQVVLSSLQLSTLSLSLSRNSFMGSSIRRANFSFRPIKD